MMSLHVELSKNQKLEEMTKERIREEFKNVGYSLERNIKIECPVKSGNLKSSHSLVFIDENNLAVGTAVEYAPIVNFGSVAHIIRPKEAKALAFKNNKGKLIYRKLVRHPGTQPNPYFERGIIRTNKELNDNTTT